MLKCKYKAFEIRDEKIQQVIIDGNLESFAEFILTCNEDSIITIHTMEGAPFLIGSPQMFLYCGDNEFLDKKLIPYLRRSRRREK